MSTKKIQILGSFGSSDADTLDGKHAEDFASASKVAELENLVGDEKVAEQISNAINEYSNTSGNKIYTQNNEPIDVPDGSIWIDLDANYDGAEETSTVIVDSTLTMSGQAADAKTTGDALVQLYNWKQSVIPVPNSTTSDNGKILTVVNGVATWTTIDVWAGGNF